MTQLTFASLLGDVARSRAALPGHRSPEPTLFVGDELAAWREAFGSEPISDFKSQISELPAYEISIEARLRSAYEAGQRCARETSRIIENPWRSDRPHRAAWQQGFDGKDFAAGAERSAPTKSCSAIADSKPLAGEPVISTATAVVTSVCAIGMAGPTATGVKTASPTTMGSPTDSTMTMTMTSDQTIATTNPIDLIAIDFLNLLVRCFHVGQPSDVHGVRGLLICVAKVIRTLKPARVVFAADGGHDHRTALMPTYKAHRPPKPPELVAQIELAERAIDAMGWPLIRVAGFEADDVLASLCSRHAPRDEPNTNPTRERGHDLTRASLARRVSESSNNQRLVTRSGDGYVVVSTDKDLLQLLPRCRVWNPFGDAGGWQTADSVRAKFGCELHQFSDWLALVGDSSDGIPGAAGIGEKTATKLLAEFGDIETAVAQAALGTIPGSLGIKLKSAEFWSQIELARKLLALVETLDVAHAARVPPEETGDAREPRAPQAGWQQRLQEMRLFAAIKPLAEAFESLSVGERVSAPTGGTQTATRPPRLVAKSLF